MLFSQEHYDLIEMFEKVFRGNRFDKEDKSLWSQGNIYQSGETNNLFLAYRQGYAFGRASEDARKREG